MTNVIAMHGTELFDNSVFETMGERSMYTTTGKLINTHKTIVDSNEQPVAVVGKKYQLVQNAVLIPQFEVALKQSGLDLTGITRDVSISGTKGRTVVRYTLPNHALRIGANPQDEVNLEIALLNSYDGSWKFQSMVGAFRMLCTNGMVVGDDFAHFYGKHTKHLDTQRAINNIKHSLTTFHQSKELWNKMASTNITYQTAVDFLETVSTSETMRKYLQTAHMKYVAEVGNNVWAVFNALTDWSTHAPSSKTKEADRGVLVQKREALVRKVEPQLVRMLERAA